MNDFSTRLVRWQKALGRHDLPWQGSRDPYVVWLSEIMLQQTQVATVIPYFQRFLARFPDVAALSRASLDDVLAHWSGLGYYSRGRNLHRAAQLIVQVHGGCFPRQVDRIRELPGVGRSTAAAISAFAFGAREAILDGNVRRVLARYFAVDGVPGEKTMEAALWRYAEALLPEREIECYTQGLMDLGATVCTRSAPDCAKCPVRDGCLAYRQGRQDELPRKRARNPLPEREVAMLLLLREGSVFLEKRPAKGIWGGLWSLPELAPADDPVAACRARFGFEAVRCETLPILGHVFTHFRLLIHPRRVDIIGASSHVNENAGVWFGLRDALAAGIPVPVRKLLAPLERA